MAASGRAATGSIEPKMYGRTRMFKTLGGLAAAMTTWALFLSWMEPPDPTVAALTDPEFIRRQAAAAVDDWGLTIDDRRLEITSATHGQSSIGRDIEIAAALPHSPRSTPATGIPMDENNFIISQDGLVHPGRARRRLEHPERQYRPIVVGLAGVAESDDLPLAQWVGLRALLVVLRDRMSSGRGGSSVRIKRSLIAESPHIAQVLRELLGFEGFPVSEP